MLPALRACMGEDTGMIRTLPPVREKDASCDPAAR